MNRLTRLASTLIPAAAALFLSPSPADACGGCFVPPSNSTVVSGHRMAFAISESQTVLWDQIQYQGSPGEFSWVLPVKPGAVVQESSDAFFEVLEAASQTTVIAPPLTCGQGFGFGCGAAASGLASPEFDGGENGGVTVKHQGTVGPYETVTLASEDPNALTTWLESHGYAVPDNIQPVISDYVDEGFDFIALRLIPGKDVSQMTPVRVVTPGASPVLPLRMVAAGSGANVGVVLYVLGEGRWSTANFPQEQIAFENLIWFGDKNDSNYAELRLEALAKNDGRSWVTSYAKKGALFSTAPSPNNPNNFFGCTYSTTDTFLCADTIAGAYLNQAFENGDITDAERLSCFEEMALYTGNELVVDTCDPGTGECPPPMVEGQVAASTFACGKLTDMSAALTGMHPQDLWVTRMEALLPQAALAEDLVIEADSMQFEIDNYHQTTQAQNYGCPSAPPTSLGDKNNPNPWTPAATALAALGLASALLAARRKTAIRAS